MGKLSGRSVTNVRGQVFVPDQNSLTPEALEKESEQAETNAIIV
jgi:hypothetical protein